jgi:hypothetical protein
MFQPLDDPFRLFELTFPNGDNFPAEVFEVAGVLFVVGDVALKLFPPEGFVAFWGGGVFTAFVKPALKSLKPLKALNVLTPDL